MSRAGLPASIANELDFFSESKFVRAQGRLHRMQVAELKSARATIANLEPMGLKGMSTLSLHRAIWLDKHAKPAATPFDALIETLEQRYRQHKASRQKPPRSPGTIYFIRAGEFVKIGFTRDLDGRLKGLQTSSPIKLELVRHYPGSIQAERRLHARFEALRAVGEWFRYEGDLRAYAGGRG